MKLSHTAIYAILATSALVNAAPANVDGPTATTNTQLIVKRSDVNEIMQHLSELKNLKVKRDQIESDSDLIELDKRADSVLGNLITALAQSGLISQVFDDLTSSPELKSSIVSIVKATLQAAIVQGPTLIKGIWNSGLLQDVFKTVLDDSQLRSALLDAGKALFSTALNLIKNFTSSGSSSSGSGTTTAAAAATTTAAAKRDNNVDNEKRMAEIDGEDLIAERDLSDIVSFIVNEIKSSGIVSSLINKVMSDPEATISFLSSALKTGLVVVEDVYGWAKSSGILADGISWLKSSNNDIISTLGSFLSGALTSGAVSSSEFDSAGSSTTATVATTATAAAVAAAADTAPAVTAVSGNSGSDDLSFLSKYASPGATTLYKKRMLY